MPPCGLLRSFTAFLNSPEPPSPPPTPLRRLNNSGELPASPAIAVRPEKHLWVLAIGRQTAAVTLLKCSALYHVDNRNSTQWPPTEKLKKLNRPGIPSP